MPRIRGSVLKADLYEYEVFGEISEYISFRDNQADELPKTFPTAVNLVTDTPEALLEEAHIKLTSSLASELLDNIKIGTVVD